MTRTRPQRGKYGRLGLNGGMDSYADWQSLRSRVKALPIERQAAFALACADGGVGPDVGLLGALESGWDALVNRGDVSRLLKNLERRRDLDEDRVAATHYALSSVQGQADAAWWAASRAMDQAFDAVEHPEDAVAFRPVEADALSHVVQSEITRQMNLLMTAESAPNLMAAIGCLRSNGQS